MNKAPVFSSLESSLEMMTRSGKPRMFVCVHEAGHAFIHMLYKIPFEHVSVIPDVARGSGGHVKATATNADVRQLQAAGRQFVEKRIRAALAGEVAQRKYQSRSFKQIHSSSDWETAMLWASNHSGSTEEAHAWCQYLYVQTKNELALDFNWRAVLALAKELRTFGQISAHKARGIFKRELST